MDDLLLATVSNVFVSDIFHVVVHVHVSMSIGSDELVLFLYRLTFQLNQNTLE